MKLFQSHHRNFARYVCLISVSVCQMDFLNLLAINQQLFFNDRNAQIEDAQQLSPQQSNPERSHKRKRLRRHPVWEYFGDIGDAGDKVLYIRLGSC